MKVLFAFALVIALYCALWLITSPIRIYQLLTMFFAKKDELENPAITLPPTAI